jgi:hypothetical protein
VKITFFIEPPITPRAPRKKERIGGIIMFFLTARTAFLCVNMGKMKNYIIKKF